jgi:hypothetical protein
MAAHPDQPRPSLPWHGNAACANPGGQAQLTARGQRGATDSPGQPAQTSASSLGRSSPRAARLAAQRSSVAIDPRRPVRSSRRVDR